VRSNHRNGNLSFFRSGHPVDAYGAMCRMFPPHPWQNSTSVPAALIFTTASLSFLVTLCDPKTNFSIPRRWLQPSVRAIPRFTPLPHSNLGISLPVSASTTPVVPSPSVPWILDQTVSYPTILNLYFDLLTPRCPKNLDLLKTTRKR
jgi:hypothetical protein